MYRLTLIFAILLVCVPAHADWQSTLEGQFDHVSTFDELADWTGSIHYKWVLGLFSE